MNKEEIGKKMGRIIVKAWNDEEHKQRLLKDATAVLREEGIDVPDGLEVRMVENTPEICHIVIPARPAMIELTEEQLAEAAGGGLQAEVKQFNQSFSQQTSSQTCQNQGDLFANMINQQAQYFDIAWATLKQEASQLRALF